MRKTPNLPLSLAVLTCLLLCSTARSQDDAIVTDRPDFVESSDVVGAGKLQIESGFNLESNRDAGVDDRTYSTPLLLRFGITDDMELRLETDGRNVQHSTVAGVTSTQTGYSDVAIGVKLHVSDGDAATGKPGTAWLLHAYLDSGTASLRGEGVRPSLRYVAEWELPDDASFGIMPGVVYDQNVDGRFVGGILAATMGKQFTPQLRGFVELAGQQLASKANGGNYLTFDSGVTWLVVPSFQLDASVQLGLTADTPDWTVGIGFSVKL